MLQIKKAERQRRPLKVAMEGLSGSGKTYSALRMAFDMRRNGIGSKILVLDTENESAGLYAGETVDGEKWDYETAALARQFQNPKGFTDAYNAAVKAGYDIIIFDSLSHAWHGALEKVDKAGKFGGWKDVTPEQRTMIETLTNPQANLIATMRLKGEYDISKDDEGKTTVKKIGTKVDQREGTEYEFDIVFRFDHGCKIRVEKVRGCGAMRDRHGSFPGPEFWAPLFDWWKGGANFTAPPIPVGKIAPSLADIVAKLNAAKTVTECDEVTKWAVSEGMTPEVRSQAALKLASRKAELTVTAPKPAVPVSPPPPPVVETQATVTVPTVADALARIQSATTLADCDKVAFWAVENKMAAADIEIIKPQLQQRRVELTPKA